MRALVTGATGFIGSHVVKLLRAQGVEVRALVRNECTATPLKTLDVECVPGDIRSFDAVKKATAHCTNVYHIAADYRLWVPDPDVMYATNVEGTKNVMRAAQLMGVERVVYTSTVGVLPPPHHGLLSTENAHAKLEDMIGHYKRSKFLAEAGVYTFIQAGLPVVIVNPSTPIGPYDRKPTPTGKMIIDFLNGDMPAYLDTGLNFIDVEDVAAGHWLAAQYGKIGERYILGNENITLCDFFRMLAHVTGLRAPHVRLPYAPVAAAAYVNETLSKLTGKSPRIPLTGVRMAKTYMFFDATKAVAELQLPQTPVQHAIERAVEWFHGNGYVKPRKRARRAL